MCPLTAHRDIGRRHDAQGHEPSVSIDAVASQAFQVQNPYATVFDADQSFRLQGIERRIHTLA